MSEARNEIATYNGIRSISQWQSQQSAQDKVATKKYQKKQRSKQSTPLHFCFKLTPRASHYFEPLTLINDEGTKKGEDITGFASNELDFDNDDFTALQFAAGNIKHGGKNCRSTSRNKHPRVRLNKLVSAHDITKDFKRIEQIHDNYRKQKSNISTSLTNQGIQKFGFEIYSRRTEAVVKNKKIHSINGHQDVKKIQDPPSVRRYELKNNAIPKESSYLLSIVDLQHRELTPEDYELLLLLDTSVAPKTVQSSYLESIPSVSVNEMPDLKGQLCSICMEKYESMDTIKKLPCDHIFHTFCIDHWLSKSSQNCPLDGLAIFA